jgi:transposase
MEALELGFFSQRKEASTMARPLKYPPDLKERAVRLVHGSGRPIAHVAKDLGIGEESLRQWVKQDELDRGRRTDGLTSAEREELAALRKEVKDLRRANEILKSASVFFAKELDHPRTK